MKSTKLALVAVLGLALTFTLSCSGDDGDEGGGIVNATNEAWIWEGGEGGNVVKPNGEFLKIYPNKNNGNWCISFTAPYTISGNQINVCNDHNDLCEAMPYSISGNKLTITEGKKTVILTRTSGIYVSGVCEEED